MTLRRPRATSTTWRHTLAIGLLALLVSVAPRAADVCQAACAHSAMPDMHAAATRAAATPSAATEHCARHATARVSSHELASAHDCGSHGSLIEAAAANLAFTRDDGRQLANPAADAHANANLPVALPSSLSFSPASLTRLPLARFASSPPASSPRPLTISLRI